MHCPKLYIFGFGKHEKNLTYLAEYTQTRDWSQDEIKPSSHLSPTSLSQLLVGRKQSHQRLMSLVVWTKNAEPVFWNPSADTTPATIFKTVRPGGVVLHLPAFFIFFPCL